MGLRTSFRAGTQGQGPSDECSGEGALALLSSWRAGGRGHVTGVYPILEVAAKRLSWISAWTLEKTARVFFSTAAGKGAKHNGREVRLLISATNQRQASPAQAKFAARGLAGLPVARAFSFPIGHDSRTEKRGPVGDNGYGRGVYPKKTILSWGGNGHTTRPPGRGEGAGPTPASVFGSGALWRKGPGGNSAERAAAAARKTAPVSLRLGSTRRNSWGRNLQGRKARVVSTGAGGQPAKVNAIFFATVAKWGKGRRIQQAEGQKTPARKILGSRLFFSGIGGRSAWCRGRPTTGSTAEKLCSICQVAAQMGRGRHHRAWFAQFQGGPRREKNRGQPAPYVRGDPGGVVEGAAPVFRAVLPTTAKTIFPEKKSRRRHGRKDQRSFTLVALLRYYRRARLQSHQPDAMGHCFESFRSFSTGKPGHSGNPKNGHGPFYGILPVGSFAGCAAAALKGGGPSHPLTISPGAPSRICTSRSSTKSFGGRADSKSFRPNSTG